MIVAVLLVLFSIVGFALSIWLLGPLVTLLILTALIVGAALGIVVPLVLVQLPGTSRRVGRLLRAAAASTLYRPTITFGDSTDLLLRRRSWNDELGREVLPGGDDEIVIENPGNAIHAWHGQPLTLVDELFGIAFDPRHAAVGEQLRERILEGTLNVGSIREWMGGREHVAVPAYAEIPRDAYRVALEGARSLLWGYEEGDHPDYAEEIFKKSQAGRVDASRARQMMLPFAALLITYGLMWVGAEWGPTGGGGGGPNIIPIGGSVGFLLLSLRRPRPLAWLRRRFSRSESPDVDDVPDDDGEGDDGGAPPGGGLLTRLLVAIALLGFGAGFAGIVFLLYQFFGLLVTALLTVAFLIGALLFPFGGFLLWWRFPASIAEIIASYYLRFSLLPFREPVFEFAIGGYDVIEGTDVDGDAKYRLATRWVGFSLSDELEELFAGLYETTAQVEARAPEAVADGGVTDVPTGYVASPGLEVEGVQGYVPKNPDEDVLHVRTDAAMSPYQYAARGSRTYKAIEVAKEKFGAGWQALTDRWVWGLVITFGVLGLLFGYLSFHL